MAADKDDGRIPWPFPSKQPKPAVPKVLLAITLLLVLGGCATAPSGVTFQEGEKEACAISQDCTVWSAAQLQGLINFVYRKAFEHAVNPPKGGI